ncbi:MAG: 50S ribosomal protein L3 [Actinobacteria bacterium]|nr:50S ribosomal protein L3 [Actinomycetota bacterium]MCL5887188.1 50S ribosomal protein L3 [Actinomycetota bacterium]
MIETILGRKLGMTQLWSEDDKIIPVTVIEAGPCVVTQVKSLKRDGYSAAQIAFGDVKESKVNRPTKGHFDKAGVTPKRHLSEVRLEDDHSVKSGDVLTVEGFEVGTKVHINGVSKGKGFAGVMKRHNFRGGPGGHGSHFHRAPGAIGMCATPARVLKGTKMPGQMGNEKVTVRNLEIVRVDTEQNLLMVRGAVPGGKGALLTIRKA